MQYALYSIPDGYFLDHSRVSLARTLEAKEMYANSHNIAVIGYKQNGKRLDYVGEYAYKGGKYVQTSKPLAAKKSVQSALTWLGNIFR